MEHIVDLLMDGDSEEANSQLLLENEQTQLMGTVGDTTQFNYLMKFEEYLEEHDLYLFNGWEDSIVLSPITIEKFWTRFNLLVGKDTDLRGAKRVMSNKEGQNKVRVKKLGDGRMIVEFQILKKYLDDIELRNKERIEDLAKTEENKL